MRTAKQVDELIRQLKDSGMPLQDAAWEAALACAGWPYIFGDRGEYCTPKHRDAVYSKHPDRQEYINVKNSCPALNGGSCEGCKWHPGGGNVRGFDCRGFTYWILLQVYGWKLMGAGATSQWNDESNWKAKGLVAEGMPEDTLVCLFYYKKGSTTTMAHTGLGYKGETVECSAGVQHSAKRKDKWTHWAVPACVECDCGIGDAAYYERETAVPASAPAAPQQAVPAQTVKTRPTIRKGNRNVYVRECQTMLQGLGYSLGICGVDGDFGTATEAAVKQFQKDHGLAADSVVGVKTWAALDAAVIATETGQETEAGTYRVVIHGLDLTQAQAIAGNYPGNSTIEKECD